MLQHKLDWPQLYLRVLLVVVHLVLLSVLVFIRVLLLSQQD